MIVLCALSILSMEMYAQNFKLESGKPVIVRTTKSVMSKNNNNNAGVTAIIERDVRDVTGEKVLIMRGTPVQIAANVTRAKGMGKAGAIDLACLSTTAVDGQTISLLGGLNLQGDSNKGAALGCGLGLGLTLLPGVGFFFFCIQGENVEVPADTILQNIVVNDNYTIKVE